LKIVPITEEFQQWFTEIREMMHREVDYIHEAEKTRLFRTRLLDDPRFIVPRLYPDFCTNRVIATAYEPGFNIDSPQTRSLSQQRRNALGAAALDLCWMEVFRWGEMQTDPNFGNYFVRLGDGDQVADRIVLLDFGAVREFSPKTLNPGRQLVKAAYLHDEELLFQGLEALNMVSADTPVNAKRTLAKLCFMAIEPFADPQKFPPPPELLTADGAYRWGTSNLPGRLSVQAGVSAAGANRHFTIPPRELMFLVRKIMGAYTFMSVLKAEIHGKDILQPYIDNTLD
jgi:hypothetical protein